jgi:GINS complex subunit 1
MSSKTAKRMLEELNASEGLPPFDLNGVQELRAEVERIARDLWHMGAAENTDESEYSTGVRIHVHDSTIARDKRCLLAYMMHRADRIELLYWQGGAVLDPETKKKLSDEEVDYFKASCNWSISRL